MKMFIETKQFFVLIFLFYANTNFTSEFELQILFVKLDNVLTFIDEYHGQFNIDGLLGVVLAQAQLEQALQKINNKLADQLISLINKCKKIRKEINSILTVTSLKDHLYHFYLLNPKFWKNVQFHGTNLDNLGIYESWTIEDIFRDRVAKYRGISSDDCLLEVLLQSSNLQPHHCYISSGCATLMFGKRNDKNYLLTHRLLFLQISIRLNCKIDESVNRALFKKYCSEILKQAKTNELLEFPQQDLFLEQNVLCGMQGFSEFFRSSWRNEIMRWQTEQGCYYPHKKSSKAGRLIDRSSNYIIYGCTDHTTGLGAAALAMHLRHCLEVNNDLNTLF